MADTKVIRRAASNHQINSSYEVAEAQHVDFPLGMLIVCLVVDAIDIGLYFLSLTVVLAIINAVWFIFTMLIFTPIIMFYLHLRDKKYETKEIVTDFSKKDFQNNANKLRDQARYTRTAKNLQTTGKAAQAASTASKAAKTAKLLPGWLRAVSLVTENIPLLEFAPIFTVMLILGYFDNVNSVKATQKAAAEKVTNPVFNISS